MGLVDYCVRVVVDVEIGSTRCGCSRPVRRSRSPAEDWRWVCQLSRLGGKMHFRGARLLKGLMESLVQKWH
jgi:hypothetical protein